MKTEMRKKDQALKRFQEQIEVQQRQIEHLTADERGELNEERLLLELRSAFPEDRIERSAAGGPAATSCTRCVLPPGPAPRQGWPDRLRVQGHTGLVE